MQNKSFDWFEWVMPFYIRHMGSDRKQPPTTNPSAELEIKKDLDLTMHFARDFLWD